MFGFVLNFVFSTIGGFLTCKAHEEGASSKEGDSSKDEGDRSEEEEETYF